MAEYIINEVTLFKKSLTKFTQINADNIVNSICKIKKFIKFRPPPNQKGIFKKN